jgi:rhodanese-related sulfurtransferase
MNWGLIIATAVVVGILALRRLSFLPAERAQEFLRAGALVIDVRDPEEFNSAHIVGAVNIPLGSLSTEAPRRFQDKRHVILLHCLSGTRSGIAARKLKRLGYSRVFNLGSYGRAQRLSREVGKK